MFRKEDEHGEAKINKLTMTDSWGDSVSPGCQEENGPRD